MNTKNFDHAEPGDARCPGPSTREIIEGDDIRPSDEFLREQYTFLGDEDLSYDVYLDPAQVQREQALLWPDCWQMACRVEELPAPRDYVSYDIAGKSYLLIRQTDHSIKAFINSCKHRGMQLVESDSCGRQALVRCPFHGWSWDASGTLKSVPCRWDFPHVDDKAFALDEVACATWGGFVFIHPGEQPEPFAEFIAPLAAIDLPIPMEDRRITYHVRKRLHANWKLALEAFLEAYHVLATHPEGLSTAGDANCQYDVLGRFVSRFIHTIGFQSPHLKGVPSEAKILSLLGGDEHGLTIVDGQSARDVWAKHLRATIGQELGQDLSAVSTSQMIDSIEYFVFPNLVFFPGIMLPMVYRFRPDGDDIDRSLFDLYFLGPVSKDHPSGPAPEPLELGIGDRFVDAERMHAGLGYIYDQDVDNLGRLQKGIRSSRKAGQTLGNYQEVRIRHFRKALETVMKAKGAIR